VCPFGLFCVPSLAPRGPGSYTLASRRGPRDEAHAPARYLRLTRITIRSVSTRSPKLDPLKPGPESKVATSFACRDLDRSYLVAMTDRKDYPECDPLEEGPSFLYALFVGLPAACIAWRAPYHAPTAEEIATGQYVPRQYRPLPYKWMRRFFGTGEYQPRWRIGACSCWDRGRSARGDPPKLELPKPARSR
jgi:hypothetical protein